MRDNVSGGLDYLRDGLSRRQDVASIRAQLEVMQDAAHVMAKVALLGHIILPRFCLFQIIRDGLSPVEPNMQAESIVQTRILCDYTVSADSRVHRGLV